MKTKVLLGALAFPLVFAACADDEFAVNNAGQQPGLEGDVIELPENFALTGAKGEDAASTRAGQINNRLGWLPVLNNDVNDDQSMTMDDLLKQENWDNIGLAWLNKVEDGQVYTNYKFTHYGWLASGAKGVITDPCNDNVMTNATWFNKDKQQFEKWDANSEVLTQVSAFENTGAYAFGENEFRTAGVDANRGLFQTDLATVFGGNYLVYYPFNEDMKDAGYLRAISDTKFVDAYSTNIYDNSRFMKKLSPKHFMVGRTSITGGTQSSEFTLKRLTGAISLYLYNRGAEIKNIKSVVLYANNDSFYTSVQLDASKINGEDIKTVDGLYVNSANTDATETSKILISEASTSINIPGRTYSNPGCAIFTFVALPVSLNGYTVVVQDVDGNSWAHTYDETLTVPAGGADDGYWFSKAVYVEAPTVDNLYAYDEASFRLAVEKANAAKPVKSTIHLLGTIELTESISIPGNATIQAETADDKIVLTRQETKAVNMWVMKGAAVNCDVEIQGQGCCGLKPATMDMSGSLGADYTITNYGSTITFGRGTQTNNRIESEINGTILNFIDPDNQDPETNKPNIVVNPYTTLNLKGALTNDGYIDVKTAETGVNGDDGTLNIYDGASLTNNWFVTIEGNMATQGNAFVNKSGATFTVKVGAQITGKGVVNEKGGEYICEVNSERRYLDAIDNAQNAIHSTTLVRFIDTTPTAEDQHYTLEGKITNKKGETIDFESVLGSDQHLFLEHKLDANSKPIAAEIGSLTILSGGINMEHGDLTVASLDINRATATTRGTNFKQRLKVIGDANFTKVNRTNGRGTVDITFTEGIEVGGDLNFKDTGIDKVIFPVPSNEGIACDVKGTLNIDKATVDFKKDTDNNIGKDVNVTANGKANFEANSVTTIANWFYNEGQVSIIPQTMVGNGEVAARVICEDFTNFGDTSKWLNGSYPQNPDEVEE